MGAIIAWLLKTALGRIVGVAVGAFVLSGLLYVGCQVKSCIGHKAEVRAKTAEKTLEVHQADDESKSNMEEMTNEELVDFARTGILPERLRKRH